MKRIVVLTHAGDSYVPELVADAVRALEHECMRIDTDRFPARASLTCTSDGRALWRDDVDGVASEIDLVRVDAFWCRRVYVSAGTDVAEPFRALAIEQARAAIDGALLALCPSDDDDHHSAPRMINRPDRERAAESKLAQMRAARELGLAMPRTIVTNDPDEVRAFAAERALVVKPIVTPTAPTATAAAAAATAGARSSLPAMVTSALDDADLADIESIRAAPMIVQERIDKKREVRAIVVDGAVYAGVADAGALDWRQGLSSPWRAHELPPAIARASIDIVRSLGLVFGALDFVVDDAGAHWFLEVNPAGEWGFLARDAKLPIADAIARALVRRT